MLGGPYRSTRKEMLLGDDYQGAGVLLPYSFPIGPPSSLVNHVQHAATLPDDRGPAFTYALVEVPAGGPAADAPAVPAGIEDAAVAFAGDYSEGRTAAELPRHLSFPPSNASGLLNPFARLPAEGWFGDVYLETEPAQ